MVEGLNEWIGRWRWWLAGGAVVVLVGLILWLAGGEATVTGDTPEERAASLGRIAEEQPRGAVTAVTREMRHASPQVREAAVVALGRLGGPVERVREALADPDPGVRYAAAVTLGPRADGRLANVLGELAQNGTDTKTRVGAVIGLGRSEAPEAVGQIVRAMDVSEPEVARTAMEVLSARLRIRWDTPPDPRDRAEFARKADILRKARAVQKALAAAEGSGG